MRDHDRIQLVSFGEVIFEFLQERTVAMTVALVDKHSGLIEFGCRAVYDKLIWNYLLELSSIYLI
jgi:hypothetical protein